MGSSRVSATNWPLLAFVAATLAIELTKQANGQQNGESQWPTSVTRNGGNDNKQTTLRNGINTNERKTDHDDDHNSPSWLPPTKVQYVNVNGKPVLVQFTYVGPPKILPIATADFYPEGSSINLICTISGGLRRQLALSWTINGEQVDEEVLRSERLPNVSVNTDDADISILKIRNATQRNSGQYTCTAKNPLGQDSTSVQVVINGELIE